MELDADRLAAMFAKGPSTKSAMVQKRAPPSRLQTQDEIMNDKLNMAAAKRNRVQTTKKYDASQYDFEGF